MSLAKYLMRKSAAVATAALLLSPLTVFAQRGGAPAGTPTGPANASAPRPAGGAQQAQPNQPFPGPANASAPNGTTSQPNAANSVNAAGSPTQQQTAPNILGQSQQNTVQAGNGFPTTTQPGFGLPANSGFPSAGGGTGGLSNQGLPAGTVPGLANNLPGINNPATANGSVPLLNNNFPGAASGTPNNGQYELNGQNNSNNGNGGFNGGLGQIGPGNFNGAANGQGGQNAFNSFGLNSGFNAFGASGLSGTNGGGSGMGGNSGMNPLDAQVLMGIAGSYALIQSRQANAAPAPIYTPQSSGPALIEIRVPRDAEVYIQGQKLSGDGPVRQFQTPTLTSASVPSYSIQAYWNEKGRRVTSTHSVIAQPGEHRSVTFISGEPVRQAHR